MSRRVALSGYLGTTIEYFDFYVYGTVAALVFNQIFFSNLDPVIGTIAAFATLAAGYGSRVIGAITFGHFGDRIGRKKILLLTLVLMGLSSGLIGLLPTQAQIGAAAPLLLVTLRLLQGFALGGEFGGAVLMTAEHAGERRRGLLTSITLMGNPSGSALGTASVLILTAALSPEQFQTWGWRIPFIISFALLAVGYFIRTSVVESPVFEAATEVDAPTRVPLVELFRNNSRQVLLGTLILVSGLSGTGVFGVYVLAYATGIGHSRSTILTAILAGTLLSIITTPLMAVASDKVGRRPLLTAGTAMTAITAFPLFWAIDQLNPGLLIVSIALFICLVMTSITTVAPIVLSEIFPTKVRYSGMSMTYQLGTLVGAGLVPLAAAALVASTGSGYSVAALVVGIAVISLIAILRLPETSGTSLTQNGEVPAPGQAETSKRELI